MDERRLGYTGLVVTKPNITSTAIILGWKLVDSRYRLKSEHCGTIGRWVRQELKLKWRSISIGLQKNATNGAATHNHIGGRRIKRFPCENECSIRSFCKCEIEPVVIADTTDGIVPIVSWYNSRCREWRRKRRSHDKSSTCPRQTSDTELLLSSAVQAFLYHPFLISLRLMARYCAIYWSKGIKVSIKEASYDCVQLSHF